MVRDGRDAASGLPVVSLYGSKTQPSAEDLRGIDVLVVDLQDAGVRFYTYASTMLLAWRRPADAGVDIVILDRPNPLGGDQVEGPRRGPVGRGAAVAPQSRAGPARARPDARRDGARS